MTFTDYIDDLAYMTRTDKKMDPFPKNFIITDAETDEELLKIVPQIFEPKGNGEGEGTGICSIVLAWPIWAVVLRCVLYLLLLGFCRGVQHHQV